MDTPAPPVRGGDQRLYGASANSINRRVTIGGLATALLPLPVRAAPARVSAIGWRGTATVTAGDTILDLTIETRVEPFRSARSRSWITAKGPATARTLIITAEGGWVERDGARKPLPSAMTIHERQQYGIYGYLLRLAPERRDGDTVRAVQPGYPPAAMTLDRTGGIVAADYVVDDPEKNQRLRERFAFEGEMRDAGVRWFKRMTIAQESKPFFALTIERLRVERA